MSGSGGVRETSSPEERQNADYQKEIPTVKLINTYRGGGERARGRAFHGPYQCPEIERERDQNRERKINYFSKCQDSNLNTNSCFRLF